MPNSTIFQKCVSHPCLQLILRSPDYSTQIRSPSIEQVIGSPPRRHRHDVEQQRQRRQSRLGRYIPLRGADQLLPLAARHSVRGLGVGWTRFDLDNGEDTAALHHNVDFTDKAPRAARQNSDAAQSDSANHLRRQACRRAVFDVMSPHRPVYHWRWRAPGDKRPGAKRRLLPRPPLQRRVHSYPPGHRATIRLHRNPPRLLPAARR